MCDTGGQKYLHTRGVNYPKGGMLDTTQDAYYSTGGMLETTLNANYSTGGMLVE